jgi:lipopolysaccharide export system protein LptA
MLHHNQHPIKIIKPWLLLMMIFYSGATLALDSDRLAVMHVTSDSATYDRNQHTITYEGNVQIEQGTSHLDGDKVVVYQTPTNTNKIQQLIAYGNPAHYNTIPQDGKSRLYIEATKITYSPIKRTLLLEGNGKVTQDGNIFSGPHIWYDMINGVVHSLAVPGKQRTEMIIQPQESTPKK